MGWRAGDGDGDDGGVRVCVYVSLTLLVDEDGSTVHQDVWHCMQQS